MRTIQEVGVEILNKEPKPFYVFAGSEYGIKNKYIQILSEIYDEVIEVQTVQTVLDSMSKKHIIPLKPTLYIVRYDESFLAALNSDTSNKISNTNIVGCIVCIYDSSSKGAAKLDKYLPEYTVSIDNVDPQFIIKYLHSDFPKLPDRLISLAAKMSSNYGDAQNICRSMTFASVEELFSLSDDQLVALFGKNTCSSESEIRRGVASRNFSYLLSLIDNYPDELDGIFYTILSTMLELEKILSNKYIESNLRDFTSKWSYKNIYNMFMNTYEELKKLRSYATDSKSSLIYLISLLKFSDIPDVEVMR